MRPIVVAQITDPHLGFVPGDADEPNRRRLDAVVARIVAMGPAPDHLVVSGDLTEHGDATSYAALREALAGVPCPVSVMAGNHDRRGALAAAFSDAVDGGFVQGEAMVGGLRLLFLDTLEEGRHAGGFCERRARWLADRLDEAPTQPTLLFLHHPPLPVGIGWMDADPAEPWIARFAAAVGHHRQIAGIACGHLHRAVAARFRGIPVTVCPSTSPELALDLAPIDPASPDDRPLIVDGAPGYALHRWDGERLVTHAAFLGGEVVARYTPQLQPMIRAMAAERPGGSAGQGGDEPRDL